MVEKAPTLLEEKEPTPRVIKNLTYTVDKEGRPSSSSLKLVDPAFYDLSTKAASQQSNSTLSVSFLLSACLICCSMFRSSQQ